MRHNKKLTDLAQKLRKNMTKEEKKLWYQFLKGYPVQFKRQVTCDEYILDFYCPKAKVAIELDGLHHQVGQISENDRTRNDRLESMGIHVVRFPNANIRKDFNHVCEEIDFMVRKRIDALSMDKSG